MEFCQLREQNRFHASGIPPTSASEGGFQTDLLYELTYTANDPLVLGIGLAATRDLVSLLRYEPGAQNPVAGTVKHTVGFGTSQSGNFIKTFLHLGFNQDEGGGSCGTAQIPTFRFAIPGGSAGAGAVEARPQLSRFWGLKMSPGLVGRGQKADADIPLPPEVRRLLLSRSNPRWGLRGLR